MKKDIVFVTSNQTKFDVITELVTKANLPIQLSREVLETPEIQATSSEDVVRHSARWAADKLGRPVLLTDVSYAVAATNGFPGPFIKFINQWLSPEQLLGMLQDSLPTQVAIEEFLAYCEPGQEPRISAFREEASIDGRISTQVSASSIDRILIRRGDERPQADMDTQIIFDRWVQNADHYMKFLKDVTQ